MCTTPTFTLPSSPTVAENAVDVPLDDSIDISDLESDNQTITITVTGGTVSISDDTGVAVNSGDGTDDASLVFFGTLDQVNTALDSLTFTPTTNLNGRDVGSITIHIQDQTLGEVEETLTFNIGNVAPEITLPEAPTVEEDATNVAIADTIDISDFEGDDQTVTLTVTGGTVSVGTDGLTFAAGDGTDDAILEFSGAIGDINAALDALTFTPTTNLSGTGAGSIQIETEDGNSHDGHEDGHRDDETITFDITAVDDAATFGGDLTGAIGEDADSVGGTATATDVDPDDDDGFTAETVTGTYGDLTIAANGVWTYDLDETLEEVQSLSAGDTLQDTLEVASADGTAQDITITINGADEAATFGGDLTGSLDEDTNSVGGTATNTDVDNTDNIFTAETVNGIYGDLIMAANGVWSYDLNQGLSDVQSLNVGDTLQDTIEVTSEDGTTQDIIITINGANDAPTVTGTITDLAVAEDITSDVDLSSYDFTDLDSGTVTVTLDVAEGTFASPTDGAADNVTETLVDSNTITLVGSVADIEAYLDDPTNVTYLNAANDIGDNADSLTITINDGDGSGDVSLGTVNIDVIGDQDAPTSSGSSGSVVAGSSLSFDGSSFNFADANTGDSLASVRIDTLPSAGSLKLSGVNVTAGQVITAADIANLTYNAPSGSATTASFTYSVNDGTDFADSPATMALTVTAAPVQPNNPPTAPTLSGLSVQENSPGAVVGSVNSNDPDLDPITYSVSDSRFEIVGGTLKLKAGQSVDFEAQETIGLTITATDSNNASQSSSFTIAVRDVNEAGSTDGDDAITGVDGDDNIQSAGGDDVVASGDGKDTVDGGIGNDDIDGGDDDDLLFGGTGQDTIKGGTGQDTLRGGSGSDMVEAGDGHDLVFAGLGDDGNDTVDGDIGNDTLGGGVGGDNISGGDGDDLLWGEVGDDSLSGGGGNDLIYNGEGSDTVAGGDGDDTIWAGEDDDLLTGGAGADLFVFGDVSGNDTITDFDASEDVLDVEYASTDFTSFADVVAAGSETTQDGQDGVLLDLGDSDSVFIIGITLDDLTTDNVVL